MHLERGQDNQISGLLDLITALVGVQNPGRDLSAAIPEDSRHIGVCPNLKCPTIRKYRQDCCLGGSLRVEKTAEPLAEAAEIAGTEADTIGVRVVIERIIRENHPCLEAEDRAVMRLRSNGKQLIG